jgi:cell division initiation protein
MDVTPQVINEVEFHQKMRGYDPDEVDDFLERVAVAVEQFQERIRVAEHRALEAERQSNDVDRGRPSETATSAPAAGETDDAETITRTLILAQRTADAAIKEAEEEAQRALQTAQDQVERLYTEAQDQARKVVVDAEAEARKKSDDTRQRLVKEIIALEETRDALRADQGILERHLDEQRLRLRSSIGELQRLLDDPGRLRVASAPDISNATMPELVEPPVIEPEEAEAPGEAITDIDDDDESEILEPAAEADDNDEDSIIDLDADRPFDVEAEDERPLTGGVTFTPPDDANSVTEPGLSAGRIAVAGASPDEDAWIRFAKGELDGPPTMPVSALEGEGEDAYLTELRKAMLDDTSAGTLDSGEHRARTRFGRRR